MQQNGWRNRVSNLSPAISATIRSVGGASQSRGRCDRPTERNQSTRPTLSDSVTFVALQNRTWTSDPEKWPLIRSQFRDRPGHRATLNVSLGDAGIARFDDQIVTTPMAQPGDSGSVGLNEANEIVGLLFAGSGESTIYNRIHNVMELLNIHFKPNARHERNRSRSPT